jgi:hypothetical protein
MNWWDVLNSPIVLTMITLLWGSLIASWIASLWQKRSHQHEVRLQFAQDVLKAYQEYVRLARGSVERLQGGDFDTTHAEMLSQARVASLIFKDQNIAAGWKLVIDKLANVRNLRLNDKDSLAEKKIIEAFADADKTIEAMYKEIV